MMDEWTWCSSFLRRRGTNNNPPLRFSASELLVLHVEPRRSLDIHQPRGRSEDGTIFEDPPSRDVLDAGLGYHSW